MSNKERLYHIDKWIKEKTRYIYRECAEVALDYCPADRWMSGEEAGRQTFAAIECGTSWGARWQYGWFRGRVVIPPEAAGERVELHPDTGGESLIYVNGALAGAKDLQHAGVVLTRKAIVQQQFEILIESYAGHDGELPIYGRTRLVILNEEAYQFFIDLESLYQLRNGLAPDSLRVVEIDKVFRQLIGVMDWRAEAAELQRTIVRGRSLLRPLLDCVNGSTAPKLFMMGQSHLDIAWLWPIEETKRKIARTLSNQLALLEEYPAYRYTQSQPYLFQMVRDLYPALYERIERRVAEGRIIPEGGMWVEPDTNMPSGESLIRQFLYGKKFFREAFGVDNEMLWLPDVFGYSGNLPQIMQKCGVRCFASVKMYQTYDNVADPFPYNTFTWEGIDGSTVAVHLLDYGPYPNPANVSYALYQWKERTQQTDISTRLVQFGYGDGGGGANRDDLEFLRRMDNLEGVPRTEIGSPLDYFRDLQRRGMPDARYAGELYYPAHRGTLTSQARMKRGVRAGEFALREAEIWSALAGLAGRLHGSPDIRARLDDAWRELLLLQFHDILPGTSIRRVHEEAERAFDETLQTATRLARQAASTFVDDADEAGIVCFNSLPWERSALVELPPGSDRAADAQGHALPVQAREGRCLARVAIPPFGCASIRPAAAGLGQAVRSPDNSSVLRATDRLLENDLIRVSLDAAGEIVGIFDKETNTEWAGGRCNQFRMFRDHPSSYDAWEIDRRYADAELALAEPVRITVVAAGPLYAAVRIERMLHQSAVVQEIRLAAHARTVEFHTQVDWREEHKLLKVGFHVNLHANEALHEIQFGYVKRPNHSSRPHDADRFEVCQHKWSALVEGNRCFSLLNDGKYGISVTGSQMNLTLLRAPTWPDERADRGAHTFTYALHVWHDGWMSNPIVREAYELNVPVTVMAGAVGRMPGLLTCDCPHVIVDSVKLADDNSGDLIVRLYEAKGSSATCKLLLHADAASAFARACETDMLESEVVRELRVAGGAVEMAIKPFEVRTIRFSRIADQALGVGRMF